jgi:hypothetical protein
MNSLRAFALPAQAAFYMTGRLVGALVRRVA